MSSVVNALGVALADLRAPQEDTLLIAIAAHGPDYDMPNGCVGATVIVGEVEASARAKYLDDAISLARGKAQREIEARAKKAEAARQSRQGNDGGGA